MRSHLLGALLPLGFAICLITASAPCRAQGEAKACVEEVERAQQLQDEGHLIQAREGFVSCGRSSCPAILQRDCAGYVVRIEERIPTVVVSVRDENGSDIDAASVELDGAALTNWLGGAARRVDPGPHTIVVKLADGRVERAHFVAAEHEKGRKVSIAFASPATHARSAPPAAGAHATGAQAEQPSAKKVPVASWLAGGVAVAGTAVGSYLWFTAVGDATELEDTCKPGCARDAVADVETKVLVARVSFGVAAAAAAFALVYYLVEPGAAGRAQTALSAATRGFRF